MVKQDIIEHLAYNCGLQRSSAIRATEGVIKLISDTLSKGESISLRGLGTFSVRQTAERQARDIARGKAITVPAHKVVKFIPSQTIKEALK
ncbi:MAG: HU family DNA-binding protein [Staphylococcus sp.]|nr:HU family DNA-binding protein [Staphylococcus sp.]